MQELFWHFVCAGIVLAFVCAGTVPELWSSGVCSQVGLSQLRQHNLPLKRIMSILLVKPSSGASE